MMYSIISYLRLKKIRPLHKQQKTKLADIYMSFCSGDFLKWEATGKKYD